MAMSWHISPNQYVLLHLLHLLSNALDRDDREQGEIVMEKKKSLWNVQCVNIDPSRTEYNDEIIR